MRYLLANTMKGFGLVLVLLFCSSLVVGQETKGSANVDAAVSATSSSKKGGPVHNLLRGEVSSHVAEDVRGSTHHVTGSGSKDDEHVNRGDDVLVSKGTVKEQESKSSIRNVLNQKKHLLQQETNVDEAYYNNPTDWWKTAVTLSPKENNVTVTSRAAVTASANITASLDGGDVACKVDKSILIITYVLRGAFGLGDFTAFTIANRLYMALDIHGQRQLDAVLYRIPSEPGLHHLTMNMLEMFQHVIDYLGMVFMIEQVAAVHDKFAPVVVEIMKFMYQLDGYPEKGMYSLSSYMNSTGLSLVDSLEQSIQSCFHHVSHCHDNVEFYYFDETSFCLRTCALIGHLDSSRRLNICQVQEVMDNCPHVCGMCCEDDPSYELVVQSDASVYVRGCSWLTEDSNMIEIRRAMYCNDIIADYGRMIRHHCPFSCDSCYINNAPTEAPITASPTSLTTAAPTPSSKSPTTSPSNSLSSLPSRLPTLTPTMSPTIYPTPSMEPTAYVPKWMKMGWDIYGVSDYERFGLKLCLSGDAKTLAVGTQNNMVRVYHWNETSIASQYGQWEKIGGDLTGVTFELSYDGTLIALGLPTDGSGRVQFFHLNATNQWEHAAQDIVGAGSNDKLGISLSLSSDGSVIAIGGSNYVLVFTFNQTNTDPTQRNWVQKGNKVAGGSDVSVSDDGTLVATTSTDRTTRVYAWNDQADPRPENHYWEQRTNTFIASTSVSISGRGDTLALGDYNAHGVTTIGNILNYYPFGRVAIFKSSDFWLNYVKPIERWASEAYTDFAYSSQLSKDGKALAVGAPKFDGPAEVDVGMVYTWKENKTTNEWYYVDDDVIGESAGDQSGHSLSLSYDGKVLAVGSPFGDGRYTDGGRVRVYRLANIPAA